MLRADSGKFAVREILLSIHPIAIVRLLILRASRAPLTPPKFAPESTTAWHHNLLAILYITAQM